jgi:hypothetical protein
LRLKKLIFLQFNLEYQQLMSVGTEWSKLKRQIERIYNPQDTRAQVVDAIANFRQDLANFFSDRDTDEFRCMSRKLDDIALDADGDPGLIRQIEKLRRELDQRGIPLLERLYKVMNGVVEVNCVFVLLKLS